MTQKPHDLLCLLSHIPVICFSFFLLVSLFFLLTVFFRLISISCFCVPSSLSIQIHPSFLAPPEFFPHLFCFSLYISLPYLSVYIIILCCVSLLELFLHPTPSLGAVPSYFPILLVLGESCCIFSDSFLASS